MPEQSIDIVPGATESPGLQRLCDLLAGLTLLGWAVQWGWASLGRLDLVLATMAIFQAWVGVLLLARLPVVRPARWIDMILSLPSLLVSGLALKLAPRAAAWPTWNRWLFVAGAVCAMASLACLGRSFAIFPAARPVVGRGPYRLIRHPAYAAELAMVVACALASGRWAAMVILAAVVALAMRIRIEERALAVDSKYREYARSVRYRLLPGVW